MSIGAWISKRRSLAASIATGVVATLAVGTVAVLSEGYAAQRVSLDDGSVWVAHNGEQAIGRANTEVFELNSIVEAEGADLELVQDGSRIVLVDRANAEAKLIDPATSTSLDSVPLPSGSATVRLAGDNVVIHAVAAGELWFARFDELASFDPASEPDLVLGERAVVSVAPDGLMFAWSPALGTLSRIDAGGSGAVQWSTPLAIDPEATVAVSSVDGRWAVLDISTATLHTEGREVPVRAAAGSTRLALQHPSLDGEDVLIGTPSGLVSVPFGGEAAASFDGQEGAPARPLRLDGCDYAAWASGTAWRSCDGEEPRELSLASMRQGAPVAFVSNGRRVVLADPSSGTSWAVQSRGEVIDNWQELLEAERDDQEVEENDDDSPPEIERVQEPPIAVDDDLGARPGRASVLPVLLNDYDANGDVLVISDVTQPDESIGRIDVVTDRQQLLVTLADSAAGQVEFSYSITDGRGGTATATVTLTVRADSENSAPRQVRSTRADVHSGGRATTHVLSDWLDPDGDPFYLTAASVAAPDAVTYVPEGDVLYTDAGAGGEVKPVSISVSDGTDIGAGLLEVSVHASGEVPIVADPFVVHAYAGEEVRVEPLEHVRGGSGALRLSAVPTRPGALVTPSYEAGSFRFVSSEVRTHYLEYVVTDGDESTVGVVRIDVSTPPEANSRPVTVPKTVFVRSLSSATVEVASRDIDPAGGVLLVTDVEQLAANSGVRAEIVEQKDVRVTLLAPLERNLTFDYRVSNGLADATGTITVVEIPRPDVLQPPIARDDRATVRVGDTIDIPVLGNDEHPDGEQIRLQPELVEGVPTGGGLLFAAGSRLRYLAPETPGVYTAVYEIAGPFGQTAQAQVRITVREVDEATNKPPVPRRVTARVLAGETVPIEIPLAGIDPDGDSVQLIGQETNPEKGAVVGIEGNVIRFEAGSYSAGTDVFTYSVVDALGARSVGTVRVGITARTEGARNPVAVEDEVRVRPGQTVTVQVLANDTDPDGSPLRVTSIEASDDEAAAEILDGELVRVTTPETAGRYGFIYTIENAQAGSSSNFLTVVVDPDAPLAHPAANDTRLSLSDILGRESIDVDVLRNVFFAEGDVSELGLSVLPGYSEGATVTDDRRIRIEVRDESQIVPFQVSHPDDSSVRSFAFVWVPGLDDAIPQVDRTAPPLRVVSEEPLEIDLADYVLTVPGRSATITDSSSVRATHSDGSELVTSPTTLRFVSADRYFGPASISFEVTDAEGPDDPDARTATIVLPITVDPRENQPPVFLGGVIEFEPAQEKQIDLVRLTNYPYRDDVDELEFTVLDPQPSGFTARVDGQQLTLRANEDAARNTTTRIAIGVRDGVNVGEAGTIELRVVPSTRPLARPVADQALTRRGETTVVDVLANDEAANPFPGTPLRVVAISGIDGTSLPAGVSVSPSADRSRITVSVSDDAEPVDTTFQYQVADATDDPGRFAWGQVTISVQDVPDAPIALDRQGGFVGGELTVRLTPPAANNSPITAYRVVSDSNGGYSQDCGLQTICRLDGLTPGQPYRFQVIAVNGIGESEPGTLSAPLSVDFVPNPPQGLTATPIADDPEGGALRIQWTPATVPSGGSAVVEHVVMIAGTSYSVGATASSFNTYSQGVRLAPGTAVQVSVHARNSAQAASEDWARSTTTVTTVGPPSAPGSPAASFESGSGDVTVSWQPSNANGAGSVSYSVGRVDGQDPAPSCTPTSKPSVISSGSVTSPWVDSTTSAAGTYTYFVYADNGLYCRSAAVHVQKPPGQASGSISVQHTGEGQFDIVASGLSADPAPAGQWHYQYQLGSSGWRDVPSDGRLTSPATASVYGTEVAVSIRACRDDAGAVCGAPGDAGTALPINTRVTTAQCTPGEALDIDPPVNGGPVVVTYRVSYRLGAAWTTFQLYEQGDPVPADATDVRIRARVTVADTTRQDPGYGQFECAA